MAETDWSMFTEAAREQWEKPVKWFNRHVRCCHNCILWMRDYSLRGDYAYNFCAGEKDCMTKFDNWCQKWKHNPIEPMPDEDNLVRMEQCAMEVD